MIGVVGSPSCLSMSRYVPSGISCTSKSGYERPPEVMSPIGISDVGRMVKSSHMKFNGAVTLY